MTAQEEAAEGGSISNAKTAHQGFLSEVFGGQLSSRVACGACDYTSVTLEPFMDLSLPIPPGSLANLGSSGLDRCTSFDSESSLSAEFLSVPWHCYTLHIKLAVQVPTLSTAVSY